MPHDCRYWSRHDLNLNMNNNIVTMFILISCIHFFVTWRWWERTDCRMEVCWRAFVWWLSYQGACLLHSTFQSFRKWTSCWVSWYGVNSFNYVGGVLNVAYGLGCLSVYLFASVRLSVGQSLRWSVYQLVRVSHSVFLSSCLMVYLSFCLQVSYLSVCLSVCLSISLSICTSTTWLG